MNRSGKTWLALASASAAVLAPSTAQAETPAASAPDGEIGVLGTCGDRFRNVEITDNGRVVGVANWDVVCRWSGSEWFVYLEGTIDDTAANGKCVWVRGERWPGDPNTQRAKNCPHDSPRTAFTFKFSGRQANGFAYQEA